MRIVTDSAAGLSVGEAEALGVRVAPLFIQFPDGEVDAATVAMDAFYDRLAAMHPAIPTTAQPSSGLFAQIYRELAQTGDQILSVHISSGLSGTLNSASVGAEQAGLERQVTFWDTLTLAGGQRFPVLAAARAARLGWGLDRILERLRQIRDQADVVFTLETVEYLARGGRIGRVQGLAGMLLHVKPVIHVDHKDGKYNNVGKSRTLPQALRSIVDNLHHIHGSTPLWVSVQHGRLPAQATALETLLRERLNVAMLDTMHISPVLGVHTGPGIVGAAVVPMALMEDLVEA